LITEFLGTNGQIESQIPSATVVAYLRAGLTPQGLPNQTSQTGAGQGNTGHHHCLNLAFFGKAFAAIRRFFYVRARNLPLFGV